MNVPPRLFVQTLPLDTLAVAQSIQHKTVSLPVMMVINVAPESQVPLIALQRIFHVKKKMLDTAALVPTILDIISFLTQMALMNVLI